MQFLWCVITVTGQLVVIIFVVAHSNTHSPSHDMLTFFYSCSSSSSANVVVELDSIFASAKHQESGFNRAWQDEFLGLLFTTEYAVKIRLQLQTLC